MKKFFRPLCLLGACLICLPLALCAAAAEDAAPRAMFPDSSRQAAAGEINAFLASLSAESIESLQVVYVIRQGAIWSGWEWSGPEFSCAPTGIDPAGYPQLIKLIREIRFSDPPEGEAAAAGPSETPMDYLAITTRSATVKLGLHYGSEPVVCGSLGAGRLVYDGASQGGREKPYAQLIRQVFEIPAVRQAKEEIIDTMERDIFTGKGRAIMEGPAVDPNPDNPPALAVAAGEIAEYNLFQDGYWARVTKPADQRGILNLINSTSIDWGLPPEPLQGGSVQLQLRMKDGTKHEYKTAKTAGSLIADGKLYNDAFTALTFDSALDDMLGSYPVGIAWLGLMNPAGVDKIGIDGDIIYRSEDPERLDAAVARLRGITLQGGTSRKVWRGSIPQELKDRPASHMVLLRFQNGILYWICFYEGEGGEKFIEIDSSDMDYAYFYRCSRIGEAL